MQIVDRVAASIEDDEELNLNYITLKKSKTKTTLFKAIVHRSAIPKKVDGKTSQKKCINNKYIADYHILITLA